MGENNEGILTKIIEEEDKGKQKEMKKKMKQKPNQK
jgi:hypothetical protein